MLNGLHEEMVAALNLLRDPSDSAEEEEKQEQLANDLEEEEENGSWEQVGPKNRSTITRSVSFSP